MKRLTLLLVFCLLLGGCAAKKEASAYRLVTGVQVRYERRGNTLLRTYTDDGSIRSMLTYLRILEPFGPVYPQGSADTRCRITLRYSDGTDSVFEQLGQQYLRQDDGDWATIHSTRASLLYGLLLLLPSDEPETDAAGQ